MSDLRPKHTEIELDGKKYGLLFDLNAIDEIQDRFGVPISELADLLADDFKRYKVIKVLLTVLINEAIDDSESGEKHVTEVYVGRKINATNILTLKGKIFDSFNSGMPQSDEKDEDGENSDPTKSE